MLAKRSSCSRHLERKWRKVSLGLPPVTCPHLPCDSKVRPVSIVDKRHYVNLARIRAAEFGNKTVVATATDLPDQNPRTSPVTSPTSPAQADLLITSQASPPLLSSPTALPHLFDDVPRGLFADQFENLSNLSAHEDGTALEIWKQTSGVLDAFVSGAGTGGTIAGVGRYLKSMKADVKIVLADPQGSGLFHKASLSVKPASRPPLIASRVAGSRRRHVFVE